MRIRRTKNLLYICSTVMVLGLALISFDTPAPADKQVSSSGPTQAPEHTAAPSPVPTKAPNHTATPTPSPTSTPTPTPTPTPSLGQLNAAIPVRPATDDIGNGITTVITDYLKNYYSNEELQVKEINNITCYYKEGLAEADYFAYVSYDISYEGSNVPIPAFDEYLVCIEGEEVSVVTESQNKDVQEALFLSRVSDSVSELHIQEVIRRYMNAKLAVDEALLSSTVTDPSYLDIENIRRTTEYIEDYRNLKFLIYKCPESVTEFDYLVFLAHDSKIVNIATPAASVIEFLVALDENNFPKVFIGVTSEATDEYRTTMRKQEEYLNFREIYATAPLAEAMINDPDLLEFIDRLMNAIEPSN